MNKRTEQSPGHPKRGHGGVLNGGEMYACESSISKGLGENLRHELLDIIQSMNSNIILRNSERTAVTATSEQGS